MGVNQHVVGRNLGVDRRNVSDAAHIRGQMVYLINALACHKAVISSPEIKQLKLMGGRPLVLRFFDVNAPDPIPSVDQILYQVVAYEPACASHQCSFTHMELPLGHCVST